MKHVIQSVAFVLGLLGLDFGLGSALLPAAKQVQRGSTIGLVNRALEHAPNARGWLFGSSRAYRHFDPEVFEEALGCPVYNAGAPGQSVPFARMLEDLLFRRGATPAFIVLQTDPKNLHEDLRSRAGMFAVYYGESPTVDSILESISTFAPLKLQSRSYRVNSLLPTIAGSTVLRGGLQPAFNPHRGTISEERLALLAQQEPRKPAGPLLPESVRVIRDFVEAAEARGVPILVVLGPRLRPPGGIPSWERADIAFLERLVREAGGHFERFDEETDPELTEPRLYHDPDHLNAEGARELSRRVAESIGQALPSRCE